MAIVKYANQSGVVYAYESISEWDPVKKQSRSKRRCLGRVDPETGEIIPTSGKRGRPPKDGSRKNSKDEAVSDTKAVKEELRKMTGNYEELRLQNQTLLEENEKLRAVIAKISSEISGIQ